MLGSSAGDSASNRSFGQRIAGWFCTDLIHSTPTAVDAPAKNLWYLRVYISLLSHTAHCCMEVGLHYVIIKAGEIADKNSRVYLCTVYHAHCAPKIYLLHFGSNQDTRQMALTAVPTCYIIV